jgi:hypothetical protein
MKMPLLNIGNNENSIEEIFCNFFIKLIPRLFPTGSQVKCDKSKASYQ